MTMASDEEGSAGYWCRLKCYFTMCQWWQRVEQILHSTTCVSVEAFYHQIVDVWLGTSTLCSPLFPIIFSIPLQFGIQLMRTSISFYSTCDFVLAQMPGMID